jgi:hypothetical protein
VLTQKEMARLVSELEDMHKLMVAMLYGSGLRSIKFLRRRS